MAQRPKVAAFDITGDRLRAGTGSTDILSRLPRPARRGPGRRGAFLDRGPLGPIVTAAAAPGRAPVQVGASKLIYSILPRGLA